MNVNVSINIHWLSRLLRAQNLVVPQADLVVIRRELELCLALNLATGHEISMGRGISEVLFLLGYMVDE